MTDAKIVSGYPSCSCLQLQKGPVPQLALVTRMTNCARLRIDHALFSYCYKKLAFIIEGMLHSHLRHVLALKLGTRERAYASYCPRLRPPARVINKHSLTPSAYHHILVRRLRLSVHSRPATRLIRKKGGSSQQQSIPQWGSRSAQTLLRLGSSTSSALDG